MRVSPIGLAAASLLCGLILGLASNSGDSSAHERGVREGACHPRMYEDGSYVWEDGTGHLCVKP
jgi:hypothetical protein